MAATTRYTQVAYEQVPFQNLPGGGPLAQGAVGPFGQGPSFNDAGLEIGLVREVTAIYQFYGNEVANDIINIYLAQPGSMIDPTYSSVSQKSPATTLTLTVGDDDVTGYGMVSGALNQAGVPTGASPGANATRYSTAITLSTGTTNPVVFAGGSALADPYVIGTLALEPVNTQTGVGFAGPGIAGSWVYATLSTLATPVAGGCLIFRLKVIKP